MVIAVVFGDFLAAANGHMEAVIAAGRDHATSPSAVAEDLHQLVAVLSRYYDDLAPCDEIEASGRNDLRPWERAVISTGSALRIAADCLRRGADEAACGCQMTAGTPGPRHLEAAVSELAAGRDLLRTHFATDPDGLTRERSEWASVVTSVPVTRALANEIARWSQLLAPLAERLARPPAPGAASYVPGQPLSESARAEFASASRWLQIAGAAASPAFDADPVRTTDTELLSAIPAAAIVPPRRRPGPAEESVAELCQGITISAFRLRRAVRDSEDRARWSPSVTSGAWQWMAQAAAITSQLSALALRAVGTRVSQLASPPVSEAQLNRVADSMADMRAAWSQVDGLWDMMITETRMLATPAMTDASDLLLRMGRLVWDDPQWTPARSRRAPSRAPAALAPEATAVSTLVSAVHHSVDALTRVAEAETDAVGSAERAGRLYVPTRSLPEYYDVPRPFAPAPASRCEALMAAYRAAHHASVQAVLALDGLAVASGAPSRVLAHARTATSAQANRSHSQGQHDSGVTEGTLAGTAFRHSRASTGNAGPVERAIRIRQVSDQAILLRAAAIDNAAHQLIAQAENATPAPNLPDTPVNSQHAASNAAQLAAQSFPRGPGARPSAGQPSRPAAQAAGPGNRVKRGAV